MSNVIFLDIDGVLNQLQKDFVDEKCVELLSKISKKMGDAQIVLISSWRKGYTNLGKCTPQIENLKLKLQKYNLRIVGRTKDFGNRLKEIEDYLSTHEVQKYVILDDDKSEYERIPDKLYLVNYRLGLTKEDVKNIINLI